MRKNRLFVIFNLMEAACGRIREKIIYTVETTGSPLQKLENCRSHRRNYRKATAEMENLRIVPKELRGGYCRNEGKADRTEGIAGRLLQK